MYLQVGTLTIDHARKQHSGNYSCVPSNSASVQVTLHVINGTYNLINFNMTFIEFQYIYICENVSCQIIEAGVREKLDIYSFLFRASISPCVFTLHSYFVLFSFFFFSYVNKLKKKKIPSNTKTYVTYI